MVGEERMLGVGLPGVVVTSQGDWLRGVELSPQSTEVSFHGLVKSV